MASGLAGRSVLYGRYKFTARGFFQDPQGRFHTFTSEAQSANAALALRLQKLVAQELRHSLVRPRVSSGMLERAILAAGNRDSSNSGFGVGIPRFLDKSAAKYWEQIEAGSTVHMGQPFFVGLWADTVNTIGPGRRVLTGRPTAFGAGSGQGFQPMRRSEARAILRRAGLTGSVSDTIRRPIEPHHYFERAWAKFAGADSGMSTIRTEYDRVLRAAGFKAVWREGKLARVPLGGPAALGRRQVRALPRGR